MDNQINDFFVRDISHVVVEFVHEKIKSKASIELVPRGWLDRVDEKWICYYPPKKDWQKVDYWTRTSKCKDRLWKGSEVCILKEATSYEKGLRRLKKFFTDDTALSTGDDLPEGVDSQNNNHINIFSETESMSILRNLPPMVPNDSVLGDTATRSLSRVDLEPHFERELPHRPTDPTNFTANGVRRHDIEANGCVINDTFATEMLAGEIGNSDSVVNLSDVMATVLSEIRSSENRILRELESIKRSILYDAKARAEEIKNTVAINSVSSLSTDISEHIENLGFELPLQTVQDFEAFDAVVAPLGEKRKSLERIMIKSTIGNKEYNAALSIILSSLLSKELQLQYSACGREIQGNKKRNFSETNTFKCLEGVLSERYDVSAKTIISKMSRWFIGASDRAGGRKQRK